MSSLNVCTESVALFSVVLKMFVCCKLDAKCNIRNGRYTSFRKSIFINFPDFFFFVENGLYFFIAPVCSLCNLNRTEDFLL